MKTRTILLSAALLMVAVPAFAGGEKCAADAQACLNHWSGNKAGGWLGADMDKSTPGVYKVKGVTAESPAAAAGFKVGDVLVAINGANLSDKEAVKKAKGSWKAGQAVTYTVQRAGTEKQLAVTLAKTPDAVFATMLGTHMLEHHMGTATAAADAEAAHSHDKAGHSHDKK
jgi:predicted metalloprotease with PDZ domain